ncbi:MAG: DUF2809 domain-containing protein [Bacteroidota bacterium]
MKKSTKQLRIKYLFAIMITIGVGLFSRKPFIPELIYPYLGDVLYAVMFYFIVAFWIPNASIFNKLLWSIGICFAIESSQLIQSNWLNQIRQTQIGGLILGFGFLWSDLLSYTLGGFLAAGIDHKWLTNK